MDDAYLKWADVLKDWSLEELEKFFFSYFMYLCKIFEMDK